MENSMVNSNVIIIAELKKFLDEINTDLNKRDKYIVSLARRSL